MADKYRAWPYPFDFCQQRRAYSGGSILYEGFSNDPAALPSEAKWMIVKHLYDGTDDIGVVFADSDDGMNKIWDSRATYTYQSS